MALSDYADRLEPELLRALERKGFSDLTAVQSAVLDEALDGRDLRISSQTGSGKTLAIGLSLRDLIVPAPHERASVAAPRALVIAPTRELAHQVEAELRWLYADRGVQLATTTGGTSYRDEHRALARGPSIVVGTPGRLLDHLTRGSIDASRVGAVVLDEADRMLDLGFRDDLLAILAKLPAERRTHLVSATFPRMVRALADKVQRDPAHVEGSPLGEANADIDHVIHIVDSNQRLDALINLLLANPDDQTLVFVRMRADAAHVANELVMCGFAASALSGEMDQNSRNRTLSAFKQGGLRVLVATDVAARGIDAQNVTRVVHAELPTNPDAYTHRSGRTGRAGRKGTSALLVGPAGVVRASRLLRSLGVQHRVEAIPSPETIYRQADERVFASLTVASDTASLTEDGPELPADSELEYERWRALAQRLLAAGEIERTLCRLLAQTRETKTQPRQIRVFAERPRPADARHDPKARGRARSDASPRQRDARDRDDRARPERTGPDHAPSRTRAAPPRARSTREAPEGAAASEHSEHEDRPAAQFTSFHVSWGRQDGADARRMLAMLCRRGKIRGRDVGAIRIESIFSIVDVAESVAAAFERAAGQRDPREPSVVIERQRAELNGRPERHRPAPKVGPRAVAAHAGERAPRRKTKQR